MADPYKLVILKISGEAFNKSNPAERYVASDGAYLVNEILTIADRVQLAIVVGGGNIVRGSELIGKHKTNALTADHIGMIGTIGNALYLQDQLERTGQREVRVMSSLKIDAVAEPYIARKALHHLSQGIIVILAAGTGTTRVTTDTAAVQKAAELQADIVLKGTKFALHEKDPRQHPDSPIIRRISRHDFLIKGFDKIMDRPAIAQVENTSMPIVIFDLFTPGNLLGALENREVGSVIF